MKEMVGGCCVCSDDRGWAENPLVYCDGQGCTVAVHQACYGIVTVPTGNWYCRKCESQERSVKVRCELCPSRDGALKPTDNNGWAHVVCALYIPEVRFGNVTTMEPIILHQIPQERFAKSCYICEESNKSSRAGVGACMQCNKTGCRQQFHVTCAQSLGLLCEEAGNYLDNVKYCGYCHHHYTKLNSRSGYTRGRRGRNAAALGASGEDEGEGKGGGGAAVRSRSAADQPPALQPAASKPHRTAEKKGGNVKPIPPYRPVSGESPDASPGKEHDSGKTTTKRKLSTSSKGSRGDEGGAISGGEEHSAEAKLANLNVGSATNTTEGGTPPDPAKTANKKHKGGKSASQSVENTPAVSPRPQTPVAPPAEAVAAGSSANPTTAPPLKGGPASIVVQVPLEAAMPGAATVLSGGGGGSGAVVVPSPPSADQPPHQEAPVKRGRSQSTDKPEKGRRSKRSGGGGGGTKVQPLPHPLPANTVIKQDGGGAGGGEGCPPPGAAQEHGHAKPARHKHGGGGHHTVKEEKDVKIVQNGVTGAPHMLGNQLNTSSTMAQKMCDTLSQEVAAHSVYSTEPNLSTGLLGPQIPKSAGAQQCGRGTPNLGSNGGVSWSNNSIPQSLDQLLERQWEQGSQFLMEQAQHFDIASLLSCLHQLRAENAQLEDHVNNLLARRDHLLAVNARLAIPLVPQQGKGGSSGSGGSKTEGANSSGGGGRHSSGTPQPGQGTSGATAASTVLAGLPVENGLPPSGEPYHHRSTPTIRGGVGGGYPAQVSSSGVMQAAQSGVVVRPSQDRRPSQFANVYSPGHSQPSTSQQTQPPVVVRRDEGSHPSVAPPSGKSS